MRPDGSFPFQITDKAATDVRETWDRVCPGWRDRKPGNYSAIPIRSINQKAKAKA
jgi:hypothetical protein